jgi:hypothetical protein
MDGHGFSFERLLVLNCDEARTAATAGCGATGGRAVWDDLEAIAR